MIGVAASLWLAPLAASAEDLQSALGTFSITFENDTFADTDHYYTSGLRLGWTSAGTAPGWLETLGDTLAGPIMPEAPIAWSVAVGQNIYTSREVSERKPPRDDRPFAGWLYATLGLTAVAPHDLATAELSLGVIGPASGAEDLQEWTHSVTGENDDEGWDYQLGNRPAALLSLERRWAWQWARVGEGFQADLVPAVGLQLGNVQTSAGAGFLVRFGRNLEIDFGPARIRPALSGLGYFRPPSGWAYYGFVGAEGRAIAYDATLDGNEDGFWRVDREPLVGELSAGAALAYRAFRLSFSMIAQTKTFEQQSHAPFAYGSLQLSTAF